MLIFSGNSNRILSKKIATEIGLSLGELEISTFPDNENRVRVVEDVVDQHVVLVQSTGISPNLYYMELFFMLDSLRRNGASEITLVIPYLGYQRQDHIFRDGEGVSLEVIIKLLEHLGIDRIISFDLHSIKIPELFHVPISHLSALPVFAKKINGMIKDKVLMINDLVLVSPDMGGIRRVELLSEMLGGKVPYISIEKDRDLDSGEIESVKINGDVKKTAIIVDDVISTGKTLISAANLLVKNGAENIYVMATHGIFAGEASISLQSSIIKKIIVSDTLEIPQNRKFDKLEVVSVASLIANELK